MAETEKHLCKLCGEPMPPGEEMFYYHGYSGDCPKPPLPRGVELTIEELRKQVSGLQQREQKLRELAECGHPRSSYVRTWPLLDALTSDDPQRDYPDDEYCLVCAENSKVNGEWINTISQIFGPIPCGGSGLQISKRLLEEQRQSAKRLREGVDKLIQEIDIQIDWGRMPGNDLPVSLAKSWRETLAAIGQMR